ncbi:MAG: DTW domain-containing protein, partial [Bdellovibrionales bacterium]|nr:DTW domain-containing protein [Bdellovibrionales bacterium]
GQNFANHHGVNQILDDKSKFPVILYPKGDSHNLSDHGVNRFTDHLPKGKKLVIFVIDGSWGTANRMIRMSPRLASLSRVCFSPRRESRFRVRKQPRKDFLSTVEAIHETIELLGPSVGFSITDKKHDNLLEAFDNLVDRQIEISTQILSAASRIK